LPGRTSTTRYDSFGRSGSTQLDLGANYPNKVVVSRSYDKLGRVNFESDPYEDNGSGRTLYGTTYNYNTDGTPSCFVRGPGTQPATFSVNETTEVYPTCFNHGFLSNQEFQDRGKADSFLDGSNQFHNFTRTLLTATGRILERDTLHNTGTAFTALDKAVFTYDTLGHRTSMTRYRDPTNKMGAVTTTWHPDSLGWVTKQDKTGVATQTRIFDSWGNVTQVQWCDDMTAAPCPTKDRRSIARYDWLNRLIHREDQDSNSGGQPIAGTAVDLTYDANSGAIAGIPRNNMLGRLASATWSTGQEWFTYDSFGQVNSRTFIDTSVASNDHHYEIHEFHDDGSEKTLHLQIQDTNKQDEQVAYGYDSAARVNSMVYSFAGSSQNLFGPSGTSPIYDAFGRIINAKYGLASFNQSFANAGRRLPISLRMTSANGASTREIDFPTVNNVRAFDPIGRERQRVDLLDLIGEGGIPPTALLRSYDGLGRLSASQNFQISTQTTQADRSFSYDPLGNILTQTDANSSNPAGSVSLTYGVSDLDRVCGLAYWTATAPQSPNCNVNYDGVGNTVSMPMRSGATRTLDWFPNGAVKRINSVGSNANFAYDAFGGLQQLTVDTILADRRADKYFGRYIKQRIEGAQSVINRRIPVPGLVATRHGPTGGWTFAFGDGRGTRFVTDQTGAFVQDVNYHPFGEVKFGAGAVPGGTNYTSEQWNGGDLLSTLGVVNLGARVYDPVIGRFLSRDPILQAKNPYAFASNDPINRSDASGMMDSCGNGGGFQAIGVYTGCDQPFGGVFTGSPLGDSPDCPSNSSCMPPTGDHLPGSFTCSDANTCTEPVIEITGTCDLLCKASGPLFPLTAPANTGSPGPSGGGAPVKQACRGNSACPPHWEGTTPPPGFGAYFGPSGRVIFHCGGNVFVENSCESSGLFFWESNRHGECLYDADGSCGGKVGDLITPDNPLCGGCAGNEDRFNSVEGTGVRRVLNFIGHAAFDEGGPAFGGASHFDASVWHAVFPDRPPPPIGLGTLIMPWSPTLTAFPWLPLTPD
jgi:RHS repeat-associated protein